MAMFKCKMCGGDLTLQPGSTVAECEYCGTVQTVPTADNEKKMTLFQRANRLRFGCEFDKAAGVYEAIVAEFPEEAEAYWGLVLCRFGIEYVDDPATGKKIPTCHRSSFDSVLDDPNLELALENTDAVARRVYREEARAIEELRKGIVEVSSKEAPYDIFICYKETDEQGGRTLDSVLAQDVYDALTEKGYRVFFSRITLEDKLGQAYEPYIFAALHSAKIMLAFGTDYEYFNAVWVKNEWSRFLSLIASGEKKTLIPCYKGIDAYDMPKEFAKLQAQDMGKVGAIQDLLRGIEKILPKKAAPVVIQEKVVVGNAGSSNKIMSLLDRGNMALEDGDWAKADSFFEDVLNNESKNAQAYIGKTLATEKCRTMDAFARKRKAGTESVQPKTLYIPERTDHIAEMVQKFALYGYLDEKSIRKLYDFDRSYASTVSGRRKQYEEEQAYWADHKWLSKAEKFAVGTVAQTIETEKQHLFAQLADRVKQAEAADAKEVARLNAAYDALIADADRKAEQLNKAAAERKEYLYQDSCKAMAETTSLATYRNLLNEFEGYGNYKDSQKRAEQCREKIGELEEIEKQQEAAREKARAEAAAKKKKRNIILGCVAAAVVAIVILVTQVVISAIRYNKAESLFQAGNYEEAEGAFIALGDYKDARERCLDVRYAQAEQFLDKGSYEEAEAAFTALGNYKDAPQRIADVGEAKLASQYQEAEVLLQAGSDQEAAYAFGTLGDYKDARQKSFALWEGLVQRETLSAQWHTVALREDGTVVAVGYNEFGQCDVSDWTDIVAVSAGYRNTVGLKADGTVVAVGDNEYGQCDVSDWTDIVAVAAGGWHTVGLKEDGTVVAVGYNESGQCDVSSWTDIVAIDAGSNHTVGVKTDGTVVAVGNDGDGRCDVSDWNDIVAVSAGYLNTVGLKADGTVVAVGDNEYGQCDVSDRTDIVSVSSGSDFTVILKADGTVVAMGSNDYGQCNVSDWTDIVAISTGVLHTVGLKADGTMVATGHNKFYGQCNVSDWNNIKLPN